MNPTRKIGSRLSSRQQLEVVMCQRMVKALWKRTTREREREPGNVRVRHVWPRSVLVHRLNVNRFHTQTESNGVAVHDGGGEDSRSFLLNSPRRSHCRRCPQAQSRGLSRILSSRMWTTSGPSGSCSFSRARRRNPSHVWFGSTRINTASSSASAAGNRRSRRDMPNCCVKVSSARLVASPACSASPASALLQLHLPT